MPAVDQEKVLSEDSNDYGLLKGVVFDLCERAGEQLRAEKQRAGRMELRVRYSDYQEDGGKEKLAPAVQSTAALCARAAALLDRILTRRTRVRSIYLHLTELSHGSVQLELFPDPKPEKQARLESAFDILRRRYGATILRKAS